MKSIQKSLFVAASVLALSVGVNSANAKVLARVNGKDVTTKELNQLKKSLPPAYLKQAKSAEQINKVLVNQLVDLRVLTEAALKSDLAKDSKVQEQIKSATERVIVQAFMFKQLSSKVNDQAIEKEYKTLKDKFAKETKGKKEMKVRHILVKSEADAKKAIKRLNSGSDFQKLARDLSIDKRSAQDGGDLGYVIEGTIPDFDAALKKVSTGKFTKEPVKTDAGYHIFKIDDRRKPKLPKFEKLKQQLATMLQQKSMAELIKRLRDKAQVEIIENAKG